MLSPATAYEMSATPSELTIEADAGKRECREVHIEADSHNLTLTTKWSESESRALESFTYTPEDFDVEVTFPDATETNKENQRICIKTHDIRAYHGVIIIEDARALAGLGVWLTINPDARDKSRIQSQDNAPEVINNKPTITGNTIANQRPLHIQNYLMLSTFISMVVLAPLVYIAHRRKRKE